MEEVKRLIEECGYESIGQFDAADLVVREEIRNTCKTNQCGMWEKSWACPPAVGDIEHFKEYFKTFDTGYVFQTVATMEDDFDFESIDEARELHHERFKKLLDKIVELDNGTIAFAAGKCRLCEECTYPDNPCRFPHKMSPSLEACGLVVSEVCVRAGVPYYHGPRTLAFVGGALCK